MIFFLVQQHHQYTVQNFLESWARPLSDRVAVLTWPDTARVDRLRRGTYVFCDYERMSPPQWELAREICRTLLEAGCRVLNRPDRVLDRASLLRRLWADGVNSFDAYRVGHDDLASVRFPCFVRRAGEHMGSLSGLIGDRAALDEEIVRRAALGQDDLLVIEFIDTRGSDGVYRKHGVFRCGQTILARHMYFAREWLQCAPDVVDDWAVAEEAGFVRHNPHAEVMRSIFDLGGIDYGRVDYGLLAGRPQVWEINTNPMLLAAPHRIDPRRLPAQARGAAATAAAIAAIDDASASAEEMIGLSLPSSLRERLGVGRGEAALRMLGRAMHQVGRTPGVRQVVQVFQQAHRLASDPAQRPRRAA